MLLTHAAVAGYDPVFKVNPPLRTDEDVAAVVAGLCDGTIDAVATDHAPHAPESKDVPFDQAPPGMLGLQTALPDRVGGAVAAPRTRAGVRPHERAAGGHRPARPRPTPAPAGHSAQGGPVEVGCDGQPVRVRPRRRRRWWIRRGWPAGAATPPTPGRTFSGAVRHTVLRGEPVVIDAVAQR